MFILYRRVVQCLFAGIIAGLATTAHAHRLDELLQRSFISVEPTRIAVDLVLSPGVDAAAAFVASIDSNHDGKLSPAEIAAFAGAVRTQLAVFLDGQRLPPRG